MLKTSGQYIYGLRPLLEALRSGKTIDRLLVRRGLNSPLIPELMKEARELSVPVQYVPVEKLNRITRQNHQGAIGIPGLIAYGELERLIPSLFEQGVMPLIAVLDGVTDVRNFGAIARTAECAGAHALVIPEKGAAQVTPDSMKASAGALNCIPVCRVERLDDTLRYMKDSGIQLIACTETAGATYDQPDYTLPTALIFGAEDMGIAPQHLRLADHKVKILLSGTIASLNVSVAAGIVLFEMVRQRQIQAKKKE